MPRKASGSSKKKSKSGDDDESQMSEKKFMTLSPFSTFLGECNGGSLISFVNSFQVQDEEGINHKFHKNDM